MTQPQLLIRAFPFGFFVAAAFSIYAQSGQWTWLKGSNQYWDQGNYGVQGVAATTNNPPSVVEPYFWKGQDNTFWIYGGRNDNGDGLAALWKYDPATNLWTWIKGPNTVDFAGVFGTQGVEASTNLPPAKHFGGTSWVDLDGNFWMYGGKNADGDALGANNDLWRYNRSTGNWTWMKGSTLPGQSAVWGTQGVANVANQPNPLSQCHATWVGLDGDLWMFGGAFGSPQSDDVWRFNIASNSWTWMHGSQGVDGPANYGTLGIESPSNNPGGRYVTSLGTTQDGMMWMHGGKSNYADLWRLNPANGYWTWIGGSDTTSPIVQPTMGSFCVTAPTNDPGRRESNATWKGTDGRFWSFGWFISSDSRNDLWSLCPSSLAWTWVHGPATQNDPGLWGTQGVSAPANKPNGRLFPATWTADNGDLYMFGGLGTGPFATYNDLWKFSPDPTCGSCDLETVVPPGEAAVPVNVQVAPNPVVSNFIQAQLPLGMYSVEILDALGRSVTPRRTMTGTAITVPVDALANGHYLLRCTSQQGPTTTRFFIDR